MINPPEVTSLMYSIKWNTSLFSSMIKILESKYQNSMMQTNNQPALCHLVMLHQQAPSPTYNIKMSPIQETITLNQCRFTMRKFNFEN